MLVTRLQVQGGGNLTQHLIGGYFQANAEPVPLLLIEQREQLPEITVS